VDISAFPQKTLQLGTFSDLGLLTESRNEGYTFI